MALMRKKWSAIGAMSDEASMRKTSCTPPKSPKRSNMVYVYREFVLYVSDIPISTPYNLGKYKLLKY